VGNEVPKRMENPKKFTAKNQWHQSTPPLGFPGRGERVLWELGDVPNPPLLQKRVDLASKEGGPVGNKRKGVTPRHKLERQLVHFP